MYKKGIIFALVATFALNLQAAEKKIDLAKKQQTEYQDFRNKKIKIQDKLDSKKVCLLKTRTEAAIKKCEEVAINSLGELGCFYPKYKKEKTRVISAKNMINSIEKTNVCINKSTNEKELKECCVR